MSSQPEQDSVHVWDKVEVGLAANGSYDNPYTEVDVWVDLEGPGFRRRVYGFWDGGHQFLVRIMPTGPGTWRWTSGSNQSDAGLNGQSGAFEAVPWSEEEIAVNDCRRGLLRATPNGRGLEWSDGTPVYLQGDTWWAVPTWRYPWFDDDTPRELGPGVGFKDMVRYRKAQGYNLIAMIAAFPQWANDGHPATVWFDEERGLAVRSAWPDVVTGSAEDMHNEGGRPFLFPGRVPGYENLFPDMDRINPAYFQYMDRKIDYLNAQGMVPFIEVARRDASTLWKEFYDWPASYRRFARYVFCRYQANNVILSPIHYDWGGMSVAASEYNAIAKDLAAEGLPAFGQLRSCNASGSSMINFGTDDVAPWITLHQIGNRRYHDSHWLLTQIYNEENPPKPALNGEPYYVGWPLGTSIKPHTDEAAMYARSGMYGSFLSGGLAGHIYGAEGLWNGHIEPESEYPMWEAIQWQSGAQMEYLTRFALSEGNRYLELVPDTQLVVPNQTHELKSNRGWAYCARTQDKALYMIYLEADCPQLIVRAAIPGAAYEAQWYDPRTGAWQPIGVIETDGDANLQLPAPPSSEDWAAKLVLRDTKAS